MTPGLSKDLQEFVALLVERNVEFLIVGSYALAFHGRPRYTKDIDVLIRRSNENAERLELLIRDFGFSSTGLSRADFSAPDTVIQLGYEPNRIDILTEIDGVAFDEAWANHVVGDLGGIEVPFIGRLDLIKNKRATGRPQDFADIAALEVP